MSHSVRTIASNCLSVPSDFSVVRDVFGYVFGTPARTLSLKQQINLVQGDCIDINPIFVGNEGFTADDKRDFQHAIQFTRDLFASVNLGIRKIFWWKIDDADAGSYPTINSGSEAHDLTDDWSVDNDALDMFLVMNMTDGMGWSSTDGPCSKESSQMTGVVVSHLGVDNDDIGTTMSMEIGHYLGLSHDGGLANFMGNSSGNVSAGATGITNAQGNTMKDHCLVEDNC